MKIGIIGGSSAGLFCSVLIKKEHPDYDVVLFEKNNYLGRKLLATGNGRCNLTNKKVSSTQYNNPAFIEAVCPDLSYKKVSQILRKLNIKCTAIDEYIYPYNLSAKTLAKMLLNELRTSGVQIHYDEIVKSYKGTRLTTNNNAYKFDKLIFCPGGKSQPVLGSNGDLFDVFQLHGYKIKELIPSLCPIKVTERVKGISGIRHKAHVYLENENGSKIFEEDGEVLFKDDGLSGIVIFNISRHINKGKKYQIRLDLFPKTSEEKLAKEIEKNKKKLGDKYLYPLLQEELAEYIQNDARRNNFSEAFLSKNLLFHFGGLYPFVSSQITRGGISTENVWPSLESKHEPNVYFAGEVLDIDGPCGGFNLTWCLLCAEKIKKSI